MSASAKFWRFSLCVYGDPAVPPACLALQNAHGLDVNLLLYCCWLGTNGVQLDNQAIERLIEFSEPWAQHIVRPLRHARTWMKHDGNAREQLPAGIYAELRDSIKKIELESERLEQLALEAMTEQQAFRSVGTADAQRCARANLLVYASETGAALDTQGLVQLAALETASARALERLASSRVASVQSPND